MVCESPKASYIFTPSGSNCAAKKTPVPACVTKTTCTTAGSTAAACPIKCEMLPTGELVDFSSCNLKEGEKVVQTKKIKGSFAMSVSALPTNDQAAAAVAAAFELDISFVDAEVTETPGRRLTSHATKKATIGYTVLVPPGVNHEDIVSKVKEVSGGGAAQDAFTKSMKDSGVEVDTASITHTEPTVTDVIMVVSADGKALHKPVAPSTPSPAPAPAEEEGGNTAAIVGGVIGGLVGVAIIAGLLYYFLVVRKKSAS